MTDRPVVFVGHTRSDDTEDWVRSFRQSLGSELMHQMNGEEVEVTEDSLFKRWGQAWQQHMTSKEERFCYVPIITPGFFADATCRDNLQQFLERERNLKRKNLIVPVYHIPPATLYDHGTGSEGEEELMRAIASHQGFDWSNLHALPWNDESVRMQLVKTASRVKLALQKRNVYMVAGLAALAVLVLLLIGLFAFFNRDAIGQEAAPEPSPTPDFLMEAAEPTPASEPVPQINRIAFVSNRDGNPEIYTMNTDGSDVVRLTENPANDYAPAWSPDGTRLAFVSERDGNHEIYVMNADGSEPVNLTNNSAYDIKPAWSPDGERIAFESFRDGNHEIYVMNADGSEPVNLTAHPANDFAPDWSNDGQRIAFTTFRDNNLDVYTMNADGSELVRVTVDPERDLDPVWSPEGQRMAFIAWRDGNDEVYAMNPDGTAQLRLTENPTHDRDSAWSTDSILIAFTTDRDGNDEIYLINADGTNPRNLTNNPAADYAPAWVP